MRLSYFLHTSQPSVDLAFITQRKTSKNELSTTGHVIPRVHMERDVPPEAVGRKPEATIVRRSRGRKWFRLIKSVESSLQRESFGL